MTCNSYKGINPRRIILWEERIGCNGEEGELGNGRHSRSNEQSQESLIETGTTEANSEVQTPP